MSQTVQDDEIDLFELFATLWAGKWVIAFVTAIALLGGYAYTQLATKVYQLEAKLFTPACSTSGAQYVGWDCRGILFSASMDKLNRIWDKDFDETIESFAWADDIVTLQTTEPMSLEAYQTIFDQVIVEVASDLVTDADRLQSVLEVAMSPTLGDTEVATQVDLKSQVVRDWAQQHQSDIGSFVILPNSFKAPVAPKKSLILALSLVLGGFIGAATVLLRKIIQDRRELAQ